MTTTTKDPLEAICEGILNEKGWDSQYLFKFERLDMPNALMAWIELSNLWTIKLVAQPELEERLEQAVGKTNLGKAVQDPLFSLLYFAMAHEHGHWLICPFNDYGHLAIANGARDVIEKKLVTETAIQAMTQRAANIVEDLINNVVLSYEDKRPGNFAEGFTLFYLLNAQDVQKGSIALPRRFPEDFSLFLNSNLAMMQAPEAFYRQVMRYFASFSAPTIRRDTAQIARILLRDDSLAEKALARSLSAEDKKEAAYVLRERTRWYEASIKLTEILFKYLREPNSYSNSNSLSNLLDRLRKEYERMQKQQQQQGQQPPQQPTTPQPQPYELSDNFHDPEGKLGKGTASPPEQSGTKAKEDAKGNGSKEPKETIFGGGLERKEDREKREEQNEEGLVPSGQKQRNHEFRYPDSLLERLRRSPTKFMEFLYENSLIAPHIGNFEELDRMYRGRAAPLVIDLRDMSKMSSQHPVRYLEREPADPLNLRPSQVDWARTRVFPDPSGNGGQQFQLFTKETPLNLDIPVRLAPGGIPDLAWIVDSSSSMLWNPEQGTGEYDVLCRIVYSVHMSLEKSGKGLRMRYALMNYSAKTAFTGWKPFQELDQIHRALFAYQGWGTYLHDKAIANLLASSQDTFLAFMVTDGGFNFGVNEDAIVKQIKELENRGNRFALFQLYGESGFSQKLRAQDTPVFLIRGPRDLYDLTIRFAQQTWGGAR